MVRWSIEDDLIEEVIGEARENTRERGTIAELPPEAQEEIIRKVGLAALKYHILKVHPRKRMTFDPKESVDLQGHTGPYVQNAYVRIRSVLRKAGRISLELVRKPASRSADLSNPEPFMIFRKPGNDLVTRLFERESEYVVSAGYIGDAGGGKNFDSCSHFVYKYL